MRKLHVGLAALAVAASVAAAYPSVRAWRSPAAARGQAFDTSWVARCALYEVNVRDFSPTGDIRGVLDGLDLIRLSGADVIWLMPIYPVGVVDRIGKLGSPYAVRDYNAIDPVFGGPPDLRALVRVAHSRGMKVILDWVPDHTSADNAWVTAHPDFYVRDDSGRPVVPRDPQGKPTAWTDVRQLDYRNPALRDTMIATMRRWLVDYDLDGFRQDVAHYIPLDFWRQANASLRAAVPKRILLLAEAGGLDMHNVGFDLTYAWDSYARLKAVWRGVRADSFVRGEQPDMRAMPPGGMRMRFTTNHDETAFDNPPITLFGGREGAEAAFVAEALLPGRPLLYDGQEVESPQKLGLYDQEPIQWDQPGAPKTLAFYRRVVVLDRTVPALLDTGDFAPVTTTADSAVISYRRGNLLVLVNARRYRVRFTVPDFAVAGTRDLLTNDIQRGDTLTLPGYGARVLAP